jgi:methionyl-tRNA formyltransferase
LSARERRFDLRAPIRIAFAGTPAFAVPTLTRLHASGADIGLVLTQPDRPRGRGRKLAPSAVKRAALSLGCRCEQPESLSDPGLEAQWRFDADVLVVVAYGLLLPQWMLDWPRVACVNLHASLLPRWRGAAPVQHAILAGDDATGISVMRIVAGLDRGPVYASSAIAIGARETSGELEERLAILGADLLAMSLPTICDGRLRPKLQDESRATYAPKIAKAAARLDWHLPAEQLERQVRAFNPWPVAETRTGDGGRLRIWRAHALSGADESAPGTVLSASAEGIDVATGRGILRLTIVQAPSSRAMDAGAYLAAHRLDGVELTS